MDYYQLLRVAPNASRKEIEQAYQRLLKESRYDTSIDRLQIENAYKTLSDLAAKSQYDARQTLRMKRTDRAKNKKKYVPSLGITDWIKKRTLPQLLTTLGILLVIASIFYYMRYGYLLQEFHAGDVLYETLSHQQFGKIVRVVPEYDFGGKKDAAYEIQLHQAARRYGSTATTVWLSQATVKARCYKKE